MTVSQMRYALEIERTGSISRAARNLYMAQPNLSSAIKDLEASLGIRIFIRTSKGVRTTHEGEVFLNDAREIVHQIDSMEARYGEQNKGRQSLYISTERLTYVALSMARTVDALPQEDVPKELEFNETSSMGVVNEVASGMAELGVCRYLLEQKPIFMQMLAEKGLDAETIWQYPMCLLMSKRHPLAHLPVIPHDRLIDYPEIIHGEYRHATAGAGELQKRIYVYDRGSRMNMLSELHGAYMWNPPVERRVMQELAFVRKKCDQPGRLHEEYIIYQQGHKMTKLEEYFAHQLKMDAKTLLRELEEDGML